MKKIFFVGLFLMFFIFVSFLSCTKDIKKSTDENQIESSIKPVNISQNTPPLELFEILKIRDEIAYQVVTKKVSQNDLTQAYVSKDINRLQQLLGLTDKDVLSYQNRLNQLRESLLNNYPELKKEYESQKNCSSCRVIDINSIHKKVTSENFFEILDGHPISIMTPKTAISPSFVEDDGGGGGNNCNWIPYTACLLVCTSTGPLLYWPCAYVCMCSFCTGVPGCS